MKHWCLIHKPRWDNYTASFIYKLTFRRKGQFIDRWTFSTKDRAEFERLVARVRTSFNGRIESHLTGRPELPPNEKTKPRTIRLNSARWLKLKALGTNWLEAKLDAEPDPPING